MVKPLQLSLCLALFLGGGLSGCCAPPMRVEDSRVEDEAAIRRWFERWIRATEEGDLELAKSLIAEDAVFFVPGAGKMDKESFAAAATASDPSTEFELECAIEEIEVFGDRAWLSTRISLAMTDKGTQARTVLAGHGLSVLERRGEAWVVIRDANTMVEVKGD